MTPPPPRPSSRPLLRALAAWPALVVLFLFAGGLGAGVTAWLLRVLFDKPSEPIFYAVTFAACGYIAVQLAFEGRRSR